MSKAESDMKDMVKEMAGYHDTLLQAAREAAGSASTPLGRMFAAALTKMAEAAGEVIVLAPQIGEKDFQA